MTEILLIAAIVLLLAVLGLQLALLFRKAPIDFSPIQQANERTERAVRDEFSRNRTEAATAAQQSREGMDTSLKNVGDSLDRRLGAMRETIEARLGKIQEENTKKLDEMRQTVDEKLQGTLEKRLGESFKLVSERLEQVYKGLGEMQTLAVGVGDLKRVLTNVKARGTWGEVQLERMLEQVLCPDQYDKNVATKDGGERVEFAIKLPGRGDDKAEIVWLPIDAKFPIEDYPAAPRRPGKGRCRSGRSRRQATGNPDQGLCWGHLRKVPEPAQDHRFRHPVPADRGPVCRSRSSPWPAGTASREVQGGRGRADHALVDPQQPANGLPHPGDPAAVERGLEAAGGGEDRVWQVWRYSGQGAEEIAGGDEHHRHGGGADQGH